MRTDQYIGLNEAGMALVADPNITRIQYDTLEGAFYNEFPLYQYLLPKWQLVQEHVQAAPWSSGPMYFLALKKVDTGEWIKETLWTDQEIEESL
jgi:hypothetical protein